MSEKKTDFTTELKRLPVTIDGDKHTIVEMMGEQRDKYLDDLGGRLKYEGGKPTLRKFSGMHSLLLSLCLVDGNDKPVPAKTIDKWPAQTVTGLFNLARELNALDEEEEAEIKNESEASG